MGWFEQTLCAITHASQTILQVLGPRTEGWMSRYSGEARWDFPDVCVALIEDRFSDDMVCSRALLLDAADVLANIDPHICMPPNTLWEARAVCIGLLHRISPNTENSFV